MSTPLSPAAQVVKDAIGEADAFWDEEVSAAVLHAVADRTEDLIGDNPHPMFEEGVLAAAHFLDLIATELESSNA